MELYIYYVQCAYEYDYNRNGDGIQERARESKPKKNVEGSHDHTYKKSS